MDAHFHWLELSIYLIAHEANTIEDMIITSHGTHPPTLHGTMAFN